MSAGQLLECFSVYQLIKKQLLGYSQNNELLSVQTGQAQNIQKRYIPKMRPEGHVFVSNEVKVSSPYAQGTIDVESVYRSLR